MVGSSFQGWNAHSKMWVGYGAPIPGSVSAPLYSLVALSKQRLLTSPGLDFLTCKTGWITRSL